MAEPSSERLAAALDEVGFLPLAARARRDEFHDFRSPHPTPCLELVKELHRLGRRGREFARRIEVGEFDATREESEKWLSSPDGQDAMRKLADG